jgi:hypothetical protein
MRLQTFAGSSLVCITILAYFIFSGTVKTLEAVPGSIAGSDLNWPPDDDVVLRQRSTTPPFAPSFQATHKFIFFPAVTGTTSHSNPSFTVYQQSGVAGVILLKEFITGPDYQNPVIARRHVPELITTRRVGKRRKRRTGQHYFCGQFFKTFDRNGFYCTV